MVLKLNVNKIGINLVFWRKSNHVPRMISNFHGFRFSGNLD